MGAAGRAARSVARAGAGAGAGAGGCAVDCAGDALLRGARLQHRGRGVGGCLRGGGDGEGQGEDVGELHVGGWFVVVVVVVLVVRSLGGMKARLERRRDECC